MTMIMLASVARLSRGGQGKSSPPTPLPEPAMQAMIIPNTYSVSKSIKLWSTTLSASGLLSSPSTENMQDI